MSFINWGEETPEQRESRRRFEEEQALYEQAARFSIAQAAALAGSGKKLKVAAEDYGIKSAWLQINYAGSDIPYIYFLDYSTGDMNLVTVPVDITIYNPYINNYEVDKVQDRGYCFNWNRIANDGRMLLYYDAVGNLLDSIERPQQYESAPIYVQENNWQEPYGQLKYYTVRNIDNEVTDIEFIWFNGKDAPIIHNIDITLYQYGLLYTGDTADRAGNFILREVTVEGVTTLYQLGKTKFKAVELTAGEYYDNILMSSLSKVSVIVLKKTSDDSLSRIVFLSSDQEIIEIRDFSTSTSTINDLSHYGSMGRLFFDITDSSESIRTFIICDPVTNTLIEYSESSSISTSSQYSQRAFNSPNAHSHSNGFMINYVNGPSYEFKIAYLGEKDTQFHIKEWENQPDLNEQRITSDSVYLLTDNNTGTTWYSQCLTGGNDYLTELWTNSQNAGGYDAFGKNLMIHYGNDGVNDRILVFNNEELLDSYTWTCGSSANYYKYFKVLFIRGCDDKLLYFAEDVGSFIEIPIAEGDSWNWNYISNITGSPYYTQSPNAASPGCFHDYYLVYQGATGDTGKTFLVTSKGHLEVGPLPIQEEDSNFINWERHMTDGAIVLASGTDTNNNYDDTWSAYDENGSLGKNVVATPWQHFDQIIVGGRVFQSSWISESPYPYRIAMFGKKGKQLVEFNGGIGSIGLNSLF